MLKKYDYLFRTVANVRGMYSYLKKKMQKCGDRVALRGNIQKT